MKATIGNAGRVMAALLVLLQPFSALAAQSPEVRKYLNSAATLYEKLEYEKALKQVARARAKASGAEDEVAVAMYQGIILADMGREEKAVAAFESGLSLDPDAKLPLEVSPKVEAIFEKARTRVRKLLAPQLEAQRLDEERRRAETEQKRQDDERIRRELEAKAARERQGGTETQRPAPSAPPDDAVVVRQGPVTTTPSVRAYAWLPATGGIVLGGVGGLLLWRAKSNHDALRSGQVASPEQAKQLFDDGKRLQNTGGLFVGVGTVGLLVAGGMLLFGGEEAPKVSVSAGADHAYVGVTVQLP